MYKNLINYKNQDFASFHVPGHKDRFLPADLILTDVTELPETDNLYASQGIIKAAEEFATQLFKTKKTVFCAGGNTLCIQTMLKLCVPEGGKIICARNIHKSVVNTMALLEIEPIWVLPQEILENPFLPGCVSPEDLESALKNNPDAKGVFVTSPNYYGELSDISSISEICKKYKVTLMVDNAHGSHLHFFKQNLHPIHFGADLSADSAHKTLPVLTGGAFLHINNEKFEDLAKDAMSIFGSTSPSYPIMSSLDLAVNWLEKYGKVGFEKLKTFVQKIKKTAKEKGFLLPEKNVDPVRLILSAVNLGYTGEELGEYLRLHKIQPEFCEKNYVVLIPSPFNTVEEFNRLENAILSIPPKEKLTITRFMASPNVLPQKLFTLREAFLKKSKKVNIDDANKKIAAEIVCPCPPAIPLVMPGEIIDDEIIKIFKACDISDVFVAESSV